jgi:hypothetical protein
MSGVHSGLTHSPLPLSSPTRLRPAGKLSSSKWESQACLVLPEEEERRWVRRHVGQARLSVLDRWPRCVAVTPAKEWKQPAQKAEDFAPPPSYPHSAVFYAVVSDEIHQVIEFFKHTG